MLGAPIIKRGVGKFTSHQSRGNHVIENDI